MTIRLVFKDSRQLRAFFAAIGKIVSEIKIQVSNEGLKFCVMDASHICLIHAKFAKEDMDEFELSFIENGFEFGFNVEDLNKILKRAEAIDSIALDFSDQKNCQIEIIDPENQIRIFKMTLIDIESEDINLDALDSMEFDETFELNPRVLDKCLKDVEILSEVVKFQTTSNGLILSTEGTLGNYESLAIKERFFSEQEGIFALSFLKNILFAREVVESPAVKKPKAVFKGWIKSEAPLKLKMEFNNASYIGYYLAPRVEESEEDMYGESENQCESEKALEEKPVISQAAQPIIIHPIPQEVIAGMKADLGMKETNLAHFSAKLPEIQEKVKFAILDANYDLASDLTNQCKDFSQKIQVLKEEMAEITEAITFLKI
jgi:proliferating cell nuclear antigen PCNA